MSTLIKLYHKLKKPIQIYWWRHDDSTKKNFGDELTPHIITRLFGYRCTWSPIDTCDMVGAGSIIELVARKMTDNKIYVWGSGCIADGKDISSKNLIFKAVRGKNTLSRIKSSDSVALGDPGLLSNLVFSHSERKNGKIGLLAHYADSDSPIVAKAKQDDRFILIDPLDNPQKVIKLITSCNFVLSSSLHGLIVSDSFSLPNAWIKLSDNLVGGTYKFMDYYSATARPPLAASVSDIFDDNYLNNLASDYKPIANLSDIQKKLIDSFPY